MPSRTLLVIGALVAVVALVTVVAVGTWRDSCRGLSPQNAERVPGCSLLVSGPSVDVTFPDGWQRGEISPSAYGDVQRSAMPANVVLARGPWVWEVIVGWDEEVQSGCVAIAAEVLDESGSAPPFAYPPEAGWSVVLRAAGGAMPSRSEGVSWLPAERDELTLPAGPATRVVHDLADGRSGTQYSVSATGGVLILACYADATPPDRWLSVAQTLELVPDG